MHTFFQANAHNVIMTEAVGFPVLSYISNKTVMGTWSAFSSKDAFKHRGNQVNQENPHQSLLQSGQ